MKTISRRQFLYLPALLSFTYPFSIAISTEREDRPEKDIKFPITIADHPRLGFKYKTCTEKKWNLSQRKEFISE
jgi:hypothetical protein